MQTYLDRSSLTALDPNSCQLVTSAVRCRLATRVTLRQLPSVSSLVPLLSRSLTHFRSRRDQAFVWFRAKTDKGIVCLADHLHCVTFRNRDITSDEHDWEVPHISTPTSLCLVGKGYLKWKSSINKEIMCT